MKLLIVLILLPVAALAGSVFDDSDVLTVMVDDWCIDTIRSYDLSLSAGDYLYLDSLAVWAPTKIPDTTTHYVDRVDSTWAVDRVECDTVMTNCKTVNDTTRCRDREILCDTVYVRKLTKKWEPLITVRLRPDELARLKELLD